MAVPVQEGFALKRHAVTSAVDGSAMSRLLLNALHDQGAVLRPRSVLYDEGVDGEGTRDLVDLDIDTFHGLSSAPASTAAGCRARLAWADADGCAASYRSFWLHELAHRVKLRCCKVVSSDTQPGCDRLPPSLPPHQHSSSAMSCLARRRVLRDAPGREEAVSYRLPDGETVELAVPVTHGLQVRNPGDARAARMKTAAAGDTSEDAPVAAAATATAVVTTAAATAAAASATTTSMALHVRISGGAGMGGGAPDTPLVHHVSRAEDVTLGSALADLGARHAMTLSEPTSANGEAVDVASAVFSVWLDHGDLDGDGELALTCTATPRPARSAEATSVYDILNDDDD